MCLAKQNKTKQTNKSARKTSIAGEQSLMNLVIVQVLLVKRDLTLMQLITSHIQSLEAEAKHNLSVKLAVLTVWCRNI